MTPRYTVGHCAACHFVTNDPRMIENHRCIRPSVPWKEAAALYRAAYPEVYNPGEDERVE